MTDQIQGGSAPLMIYTRGDGYIKDSSGVYGQVGTLEVLGRLYETIERCDRVALAGGRTYICKLETATSIYVGKGDSRRLRKQIRPVGHGKLVKAKNAKTKEFIVDAKGKNVLVEAAILLHAAFTPSELEGCFAPGFVNRGATRLDYTIDATEIIWDLCGGADKRECQLKVIGDMKPASRLKPYKPLT